MWILKCDNVAWIYEKIKIKTIQMLPSFYSILYSVCSSVCILKKFKLLLQNIRYEEMHVNPSSVLYNPFWDLEAVSSKVLRQNVASHNIYVTKHNCH